MTVSRCVSELIAAIGSGAVVVPGGGTATVDELWREAAALSHYAPGRRVVIAEAQGAALLRAVLSVWRSGGVPVLGVDPQTIGGWPDSASVDDARHALIHASSGSTGRPKLARRSFESLASEAERYVDRYAFSLGARAYVAAPITHSFAFGAMLGLLAAGALIELAANFNPRSLARALSSRRYDIVILTAPMARLAIEAAGDARSCASTMLVIAGAGAVPDRLDREFRRTFGCALARNYGASETGATFGASTSLAEGCIGRPFAGVRIVSPRPSEGEGELVLDLGHAVAGRDGEASTREMQRGLWRTGDLVDIAGDGNVMLRGRIDDRVKINGRLIDGAAIAARARAMAGVADALALAVPRPERAEIQDLVLVVETRRDRDAPSASEIASTAAVPLTVLPLDSFPRTAAGKPDRAALLRLAQHRLRPPMLAGSAEGPLP